MFVDIKLQLPNLLLFNFMTLLKMSYSHVQLASLFYSYE